MSITRDKQTKRKWSCIKEHERYVIEYALKDKKPISMIAKDLGKSRSTIYAEIKRGTVKQLSSTLEEKYVYLADYAQRDYEEKAHEKGRTLKVGNDMGFIRFVEERIKKDRFSPVACLMSMKNADVKTKVCQKTLYTYIHSGVFLNLTSRDLPYKVSKERQKKRQNVALKNIKGKSIEERPKEILNRDTFGHWEIDTVYSGKGSTKCLLVLTERKTRYEELYYMNSRTQSEVVRVLNDIEKKLGLADFVKRYKTITSDNGVEFLDFNGIENSVTQDDKKRTTMYYCHPYCSCERGSNENQNKLIRRWIPKGSDIGKYEEIIPFIQDWINSYPRMLFQGLSSNDMIATH